MSFQKLATIYHSTATAYPQPISNRQAADESSSEDSDSDHDSEHLLDYNARILRRRQVQARARNRLQPVFDLISDGLQPVRHLANRIGEFFDEAGFQLHVVVLTIGRLLLGLLWFVLEAIWWTVWSILFLIGDIIWRVLDLVLRIVFAISQMLRHIPRHIWAKLPLVIMPGLIVFSLFHGFLRMTSHICDDPGLIKKHTTVYGVCNFTMTIEGLRLQNKELDKLVYANDEVLHSISDMASTGNLSPHPGYGLMRETTALVDFVQAHKDSLKTFSKRYDIVAVAKAVHSNVTALNKATEIFVYDHKIRLNELETKAQRILANAKGYKIHTPNRRFWLESTFNLLPNLFFRTGAALQSWHYVGVATHFLNSPQSTAIQRQSNQFTWNMYQIKQDLATVLEATKRYEPYWRNDCQRDGEAVISGRDCGVIDLSDLNERLAKALQETDAAVKKLNALNTLHKTVREGMEVLRTNLIRLLKTAAGQEIAAVKKIAAGKKTAAGKKAAASTKTTAGKKLAADTEIAAGNKTVAVEKQAKLDKASSRAILHSFVVEVGLVDLLIGYGTFVVDIGFDDGVAMGSRRYKRSADGRIVPHLEQYRNQAQGDGSYFWGPW